MAKRRRSSVPKLTELAAPTLRAYLRKSGESQHDLARRVGVNQSTISQLCNGGRNPSGRVALRISKATGVPVEAILKPRRRRKAGGT